MYLAADMVHETIKILKELDVTIQTDNPAGPVLDSHQDGAALCIPETAYPIQYLIRQSRVPAVITDAEGKGMLVLKKLVLGQRRQFGCPADYHTARWRGGNLPAEGA